MRQEVSTAGGTSTAMDHWYPRYHVTGERNWINDPNGPVHWSGRYHLFFQANPEAPFWGPPRWGHVSSPDLVRWERHELALTPGASGPDADGCWSGCVREVDGRPAIYYTGVVEEDGERVEAVCRAWGSADLSEWTKDVKNPLVPAPPVGLGSGYHRDPFLWHDGRQWQMLLGSGTLTGERHGLLVRYESEDGSSWDYRGVFFSAPRSLGGVDLGEHWECPQLVFDGEQAMLVLSCQDPESLRPLMRAVYFVGAVVDGRFEGEFGGVLDHGDAYYAPAVMTDGAGRTLLWGWAQERAPASVQSSMRQVGALTLPRVVSFDGAGVRVAPAPELERLRREPLGTVDELARGVVVYDPAVELAAALDRPGDGWTVEADDAGLAVTVDEASTAIHVRAADPVNGERLLSLPRGAVHGRPQPADVRVFIDGSLVEVFAGGEAMTTRVYWSTPHLRVTSAGGSRARAWKLDTSVVSSSRT